MRCAIIVGQILLLTGCEWFAITIEADTTVAENLDSLNVEVAAMDTSSVCYVKTMTFPDESTHDLQFPETLVFFPGKQDFDCIAVRATGTYEGDEVIMVDRIFCPDFNERVTEEFRLETMCIDCEPGQTCEFRDGGYTCGDRLGWDSIFQADMCN